MGQLYSEVTKREKKKNKQNDRKTTFQMTVTIETRGDIKRKKKPIKVLKNK